MFNLYNVFELIDQEKENVRERQMHTRLSKDRGLLTPETADAKLERLAKEARHWAWVEKTTTPRLAIAVAGWQTISC